MNQTAQPPEASVLPFTIAYFRSGWAFLIPYLAAYLLYAWLKWPVNPSTDLLSTFPPSTVPDLSHFEGLRPPCLLHVYWFIHAIHLVLGTLTLRAWWRYRLPLALRGSASSEVGSSVLWSLVPWLCLGLLFYIPGVYMEFPADPWHHYARVNEWSWLQIVTEHSTWKKSSYYLAYSLIGHISPPVLQLKWFDAYYTACCLLLCWQYYQLARAVGLGCRASFMFVLIQALTFGNNIFGFYRYYGMSSSLLAQLGAIALTRIVLESAKGSFAQNNARSLIHRIVLLLAPSSLLLALTAFNHVQGLGIAGLGIAAVLVWRLIEWRRSMIGWLILIAIILSAATIGWYPRHPAIDTIYRPQGWLTPWYSFNLFQPSSPAFDRTAAIVGLSGLVNLIAGLLLLRRNHLVAWLTVLPVGLLSLPCIVIPFANALAATAEYLEGGYIIAFSRMLLAIPTGLAFVMLSVHWLKASSLVWRKAGLDEPHLIFRKTIASAGYALSLFSLFTLATIPANGRYFNRLYNVLMVPPNDLAMQHIITSPTASLAADRPTFAVSSEELALLKIKRGSILTTQGIGYVLNASARTLITGVRKWMTWPSVTPPSAYANSTLQNLRFVDRVDIHNSPYWPIPLLFSTNSFSGHISGHWLTNEVALEHATQSELFAPAPLRALDRRAPQIWLEWSFSRNDNRRFAGRGPESGELHVSLEDRGSLNNDAADQLIHSDDQLILRPVLRTLDGNGWRIILEVRGPGLYSHHVFTGLPSLLGGETWLYDDYLIRVKEPGRYEVEITGLTLMPKVTTIVRYHFMVLPISSSPK